MRVYKLMRDVIMGVENSIAIKLHRTPESIRAYCELFIYVFPFFYAPSLIKNIVFPNMPIPEIEMIYRQFVDVAVGLSGYGFERLKPGPQQVSLQYRRVPGQIIGGLAVENVSDGNQANLFPLPCLFQ